MTKRVLETSDSEKVYLFPSYVLHKRVRVCGANAALLVCKMS